MKPPLTYYGGKQKLSELILKLIPKHFLYCEPFFGGGAVFFAKEPSMVEVINDTNGELINFYKVIKNQFPKLQKEIKASLHSRLLHQSANIILKHPELFDEIKRAWAVWVSANQSMGSIMGNTWRLRLKENSSATRIFYKREAFTETYAKRLEKTQIECRDAISVISSMDCPDAFFYCDPPYFNSNMGHYKGYTEREFESLLTILSKIKGKFLLSSYPSTLLAEYSKKYKWKTKQIEMQLSASSTRGAKPKLKTEVLTGNYDLCLNST